ncbi:unnamed protein product [Calypogeia fissa]
MNKVDDQVEGIRWDDGSDIEYDSDASLSDSDGSEGEVPIVNDGKASNSSNKPVIGVGAIGSNPRVSVAGGLKGKPSTIATPTLKGCSFTSCWKPVIDGKIQVSGEAEAPRVQSSSTPSSKGTTSSQKSSLMDTTSASPATTSVMEPKKDGNESDADVQRVPEMGAAKGGPSSGSAAAATQGQGHPPMKRRRGGASADKEHKRLKRLLRNRVSAQQARERKKAYLSDLEVKAKEQTRRIEELEEKVNTLSNENSMLRQLLQTSGHAKKRGSQNEM